MDDFKLTIGSGKTSQRGGAVVLIIAGIAALSVMAIIGSTLLSTVVSGNQRSSLNTVTRTILAQAAGILTAEANRAGSYPVATAPAAWSGSNPSAAPAIGSANAVGLITAASAAAKVDAWGSNLGYCTYTAAARGDPLFAILSAGPDKTFQTTCTQAFAGAPQGDDGVQVKSATNILQGVGGTVYHGAPVANLAALNALAAPRVGEMRVALDTGFIYVNKTGTAGAWTLSGAGGTLGQGAPLSCPAGYVLVPEYTLPDGEYVASFCVMQYHARSLNTIVTADQTVFTTTGPHVGATWRQARSLCSAAGATLITESQSQSIAHQAVSVASNWSGGAVGSGVVPRGWSANTAYGDAFTNTAVAPANDASCLYNTGANTCGATGTFVYRRTLNLPNGSVIWDFGGNVRSWVDAHTIVWGIYNWQSTPQWMSYNSTTGDISPTISTNVPLNKRPPNGWNAAQGMGRYYEYLNPYANCTAIEAPSTCSNDTTGWTDPFIAYMRGGTWGDGSYAGPFVLVLYFGRTVHGSTALGYRCTSSRISAEYIE